MSEGSTVILVVDDDETKRYATSRLLRRAGYVVLEGGTGHEALALVDEKPDLVILDVKLPDLDGYEVARRIKSNPHTAVLPVLQLSATFVREEHRARGLDSGADGYLTYPVEPVVLLAQVRAFLRLRQMERERTELLTREREARSRAETLQARFELLAQVGEATASSLDARRQLEALSLQLVPAFSDFALFTLATERGGADLLLGRHARGEASALLERLASHGAPLSMGSRGLGHVLRMRTSDFADDVDGPLLSALGGSAEEQAAWAELAPTSFVAVPLQSGGELLGAMMVGTVHGSDRRLTRDDLVLAEDIARRAAVSLENARLFAVAQQERQRVEEANRAKDEFLATVSHELRTPLSAILGWAQLLRTGRLVPEKHDRALETIERNARAQTQLIDDLLDISRIITGKMRLSVRPVEPNRVLEAVLESSRPAASAKDLRLKAGADLDVGSIVADPDRLQQVVWNLVSNAIKFTPRGGEVSLWLRSHDDAVEIEVSDTGQGISAEFLPHVFERFRQAEGSSTRAHGGMGLGLAIVRHLVELHGGTVQAASEGENRGARFVVRLPRSSQAPSSPEETSVAASVLKEGIFDYECVPDLAGVRVLLVEDESDARELLRHVLEQCNVEVTTVRSAQEALAHFERGTPPQVLISDIGMPGEDGYSLIRKIRSLPPERGGRVPALALTAYARSEDRTRALMAGYHMHVSKPVVPAEIIASVASLVRQLS